MAGRILVGVDGSEGSLRALRWALKEAAVRGQEVDAVIVWQSPYDFGGGLYYLRVDEEEIVRRARERLAESIAEVAGQTPSVEIHQVVLQGDPAKTLCAWSGDADLLIVGSRGHGGFAPLSLGSVSSKCAHHSRCPVVIVPKGDDDSAPGST
jgi:nucleotide-binding universal stress UspA family protein